MANATKAKPTKNGRPRKKQGHLPGMEPPSIPKIDMLAEDYVFARNDRMEALREEIAKRDLLYAAMKEKNLTSYKNDVCEVVISATEKVKVKRLGDEEDEAGDE